MAAKAFTGGLEDGAACAIVRLDASLKWKDCGFNDNIMADTEMFMHVVAIANSRMPNRLMVVSCCFLHNNFTSSTVARMSGH